MNVEEEIRQLIDQGKTREEIANILGMHIGVVTRHISLMSIRPPTGTTACPYGLTDATAYMRSALGALVTDLRSTNSSREVSRITGLNQREQLRASRRPYTHDWKLSQIERTLTASGVTLKELI